MLYPSQGPCRHSATFTRWASWTCWGTDHPCESIGLCYSMNGSEYMFSSAHTHLDELITTTIIGRPSIVFKRHGKTTIQTPKYGEEALPCHALVGYDANRLYPWAWCRKCPSVPATSGKKAWLCPGSEFPSQMPALTTTTLGSPCNGWPTRWRPRV